MKQFLLLLATGFFAFSAAEAQLPVTVYDFESNSNRNSTGEKTAELSVNPSSAATLTSAGSYTYYAGAGDENGNSSSNTGICIGGSNFGTTSSTDPKTAATEYFSFPLNTSGFSGISLSFDYLQPGSTGFSTWTSATLGINYSTDGGSTWTWLGTQGGTLPDYSSSWENTGKINLPAACNDQSDLVIAVYGFKRFTLFGEASPVRLDNFCLYANSTVAGKTFTTLNENTLYTSLTSGLTGSLIPRGEFNCSGSGTVVTLGSNISMASGNTFTVGSGAALNTGSSTPYTINGSGNFTVEAGGKLIISNTAGITSGTTASGNIQVTGTRNFNAAGNYTYINPAGTAQVTGNGLPAALTGDLEVNNTSGVTLSRNTSLSSPSVLYLTKGTLTNTNTLTLNNSVTINRDAGTLSAAPAFSSKINLIYSGSTTVSSSFEMPTGTAVLNDLTLSKTAKANTVTLNADIYLNGTFYPSTGTLNLATKNFTVRSTSTYTAAVAAFDANTAALSYGTGGGFTIERYMPAKTAWRFIAAPVTAASSPTVKASWQETGLLTSTGYGTRITGPSGTGLDAATPGYSVKSWDMASGSYIAVSNTNNNIANPQGYMVYVRGDRSIAPGGTANITNLRMKGQIITGNQTVSVSANKYQSFGNPYPARIDFRQVTKTNMVNAFIIWNPNTPGNYNAGGYETYTFDGTNYKSTSGTIRNYIESGEAVFVQSLTGGSLLIKESAKTGGSSVVSFMGAAANNDPEFHVDLYAPSADGNYFTDGVQFNFSDSYSNQIDNEDVRKIMNTADNISIAKNDYKLVVERHELLSVNDTVRLDLSGTRIGTYQFKTSGLNMPVNMDAFLEDTFTGTETNISMADTATVSFAITADAQSRAADRFYIVFRPVAILPVTFTAISANRITEGKIAVKWNTENEINIHHYELQRSGNGNNFTTISNQTANNNAGGAASYAVTDQQPLKENNYYRVAAVSVNGQVQYSPVAKVAAQSPAASLSVYPNPAENKTMNINFAGKAAGKYQLQLLDMNGRSVYSTAVTIAGNNEIRSVVLPADVSAGMYQLQIISGTEKENSLSVMIK